LLSALFFTEDLIKNIFIFQPQAFFSFYQATQGMDTFPFFGKPLASLCVIPPATPFGFPRLE